MPNVKSVFIVNLCHNACSKSNMVTSHRNEFGSFCWCHQWLIRV